MEIGRYHWMYPGSKNHQYRPVPTLGDRASPLSSPGKYSLGVNSNSKSTVIVNIICNGSFKLVIFYVLLDAFICSQGHGWNWPFKIFDHLSFSLLLSIPLHLSPLSSPSSPFPHTHLFFSKWVVYNELHLRANHKISNVWTDNWGREVSPMSTLGPKTRPRHSRSLDSQSTVSIHKFIPGPTVVYHFDLTLAIAFEKGKSKLMEWWWDNCTRSHQVGPVSGFLAHEEHWSLRTARHQAWMKCEMCRGLKRGRMLSNMNIHPPHSQSLLAS